MNATPKSVEPRKQSRLAAAMAVSALFLLVGCQGQSSASVAAPGAGATAGPTGAPAESTAESSAAATSEPIASPAASAATIGAEVGLGTLLPTTLGGGPVTTFSFTGEQLSDLPLGNLAIPQGAGGIGPMADDLGAPVSELEGAAVVAPDHEQFNAPHAVMGVRFPGAAPQAIMDGLPEALGGMRFLAGQDPVERASLGGKAVMVLGADIYFYAVGDVAFIVWTSDPAEAEDVVAALP